MTVKGPPVGDPPDDRRSGAGRSGEGLAALPAREALLQRVMAHVARSGLSDVSLRELAEAVGTSHRMLIYHFGSRAGLVAAVVRAVEADQRAALARLAQGVTDPRQVVARQWAELSQPAMAPFVRLFFDVTAQALFARPGTEGFLDELVVPWLDAAEEVAAGLGVVVSRAELRLGMAVVRGLLMDAVATGDVAGATDALERFLALWPVPGPASRPS